MGAGLAVSAGPPDPQFLIYCIECLFLGTKVFLDFPCIVAS